MIAWWCLLVAVGIFYYIYDYILLGEYWRKIYAIKGVPGWPIIGNALYFGSNQVENLRTFVRIWKQCGHSTFRLKVGRRAFIVISSPECVEVILKSSVHVGKSDQENRFVYPWLGHGLVTAPESVWRGQRKAFTPAFHFATLDRFVSSYNKHTKTFLDILERKKGRVLNIEQYVKNLTLDIITESAMGVSVNAQKDTESKYIRAVNEICNIFIRRAISPYKRYDWIFPYTEDGRIQKRLLSYLLGLSDKVISQRREVLKDEIKAVQEKMAAGEGEEEGEPSMQYGKGELNMLDMILLTKKPDGHMMDSKTIRDEVNTIIFAGFDTSSSAISFCLFALSKHRDIQARAFEEQASIFGSQLDRDVALDDLKRMKYLENIVKEAMRIFTTAPVIVRTIKEDLSLPDGTEIPANAIVLLSLLLLHHHPQHFPEPERFDPDRFLPEAAAGRPTFSYVPFSAGPRNCIAQRYAMNKIKSVLSLTLRRYELLYAGDQHEPHLHSAISMRSDNGIHLLLQRRKLSSS